MPPFAQIALKLHCVSASDSNFKPRNTQCIPAFKIFALHLKFSPSLNLNKIEHFSKVSFYLRNPDPQLLISVTTQVVRFTVGCLDFFIFLEIVDLPARALTSTCFFNYTLNIPSNLFFSYISGPAWQAGKSTNCSTCSYGLLVDIFEFSCDMYS